MTQVFVSFLLISLQHEDGRQFPTALQGAWEIVEYGESTSAVGNLMLFTKDVHALVLDHGRKDTRVLSLPRLLSCDQSGDQLVCLLENHRLTVKYMIVTGYANSDGPTEVKWIRPNRLHEIFKIKRTANAVASQRIRAVKRFTGDDATKQTITDWLELVESPRTTD